MKTIDSLNQFKDVINENEFVLINFYAEWRDSCRKMLPVLQNLSENNPGRIVVAKIEVNDLPELAIQFDELYLPDLYFFKTGLVIEKLAGYITPAILQEKVDKLTSIRFHDIPPRGH